MTNKYMKIRSTHSANREIQLFMNFNRRIPFHLAIPLIGIHPRELKQYVHTKTYTPASTTVLFVTATDCTPPKRPPTVLHPCWNTIQQQKGTTDEHSNCQAFS